jgi:DNA-binding SARP family transcriptional activator/TolB-like protein
MPAFHTQASPIGLEAGTMALEISVLGPLVVKSEAGQIEGFSRKTQALLGYLAVQRGRLVSRERLADLLWPDQASEQARHSLRNCLFGLRRMLGVQSLPHLDSDASHCRLAGALVDLARFEELSQASTVEDLERTAALYRGEFLSNLTVPSAPFEEWLGTERERVRALFCEILQRLATRHDAQRDDAATIATARRLVEIDPWSEIGYRILMRAYARSSRRSEALRQYRICAAALKRDLGVAPEAETRMLASEIAGTSGSIEPALAEGGREGAVIALCEPPSAAFRKPRPEVPDIPHLRLVAASEARPVRWPRFLPRITVALSPFNNLTGTEQRQGLLEGFADDLVTDLVERGRGLLLARVVESRGILALFPAADAAEIGYAVCGTVQNGPAGTIRVNAQIRDATTGEYRWARRYALPLDKAGSLQTTITGEIARELHFMLLQEVSRRAFLCSGKRPGLDECLSRAAAALEGQITPELTAQAQNWLLGALARNPRHVQALVELARTCQLIVSAPWWADAEVTEAALQVGREAVATALSLAPGHAGARAVEGMLFSAAGDLERAAEALAAALEAEPTDAVSLAFAGYNGALLGRAGEASAMIGRAMRLDRSERRHSVWLFFLGFSELLLGRGESALNLFGKSLERNPGYGGARLFRAAALLLCGRPNEAKHAASLFRQEHPRYGFETFAQQWLERSRSPTFRRQINPTLEGIRSLGATAW